jgi:DNA-directed RNA polymerase subunit L/DNA-directed RNA polymerase alpha subunit
MNPVISNISEEGDVYKFTLAGLNVSIANAIRRTILSEIPVVCFHTETFDTNQCDIQINTTRLHNEILKHRLSCIPVHIQELDILPGKYILELDMQNNTDNIIIVTTEHFKIRNKENGNYLTESETRKIFPPNNKTNYFIDFARLRPKISDNIVGERIKLTAEFSVHNAKDNSMYNVVSKCSYGNTADLTKAKLIWDEHEDSLRAEQMTPDEIDIKKKNFYILDANRHYVENSFDFVIQTVGVYDNKDIVKKACIILKKKLTDMIQSIDSNTIPITISESTIDFCYDIVLENEDYTLGKVLEYFLYEKYYARDKIFTFCGFKKFHPHNSDSIIRVAYKENADKRMVAQHLRIACAESIDIYDKIGKMF